MAHPELQRGDTGDDVRLLQERLALHLADAGIQLSAVDGDFGPITEESVRHFQQQNGLTADGVVGERTWELLDQDPGGGSTPTPTPGSSTLRFRALDLTIPWSLRLQWQETSINDINLQLSNFDLTSQPGAQLDFLQPVGRLFGAGGVEVIHREVRTWPNWFVTWSVQGVVDWSDQHGLVLGTNNEAEIGARLLRGVDLTATGNLDLRWHPMDGTGSIEPSGSIMLKFDILQWLP